MKLLYLMMKAKELQKDIVIELVNQKWCYKMVLEYQSSGDVELINFDEDNKLNPTMNLCWLEADWKEIEVLKESFRYLRSNNLI